MLITFFCGGGNKIISQTTKFTAKYNIKIKKKQKKIRKIIKWGEKNGFIFLHSGVECPLSIRESLSILHSFSQDAEIKVSPQETRRKWEIILVITGRCSFSAGISP